MGPQSAAGTGAAAAVAASTNGRHELTVTYLPLPCGPQLREDVRVHVGTCQYLSVPEHSQEAELPQVEMEAAPQWDAHLEEPELQLTMQCAYRPPSACR